MTDQPRQRDWLRFYRQLLQLRRKHIVPRLSMACRPKAQYQVHEDSGLSVRWEFNEPLGTHSAGEPGENIPIEFEPSRGASYLCQRRVSIDALQPGTMPAWSVVWCLQ